MPQSLDAEFRLLIHSLFDGLLSGNLPPGYNNLYRSIADVRCSWYSTVVGQHALTSWDLMSRKSSRPCFCMSNSKFAPRKRLLVKAVSAISLLYGFGREQYSCSELERPCERNERCLGKGFAAQERTAIAVIFAQCVTGVLKLWYTVLESFADPCK